MFISITNPGKNISLHQVVVPRKPIYLNLQLIYTCTKTNAQTEE
jgi:hypothetical protein